DSSANEISIHTRGTAGNDENEAASLGRISPSVILSDGQVHTMRIRYQPGALEIYVDNPGIPILTVPWDFATGGTWFASGAPVGGLGLTNGQAWCGFTATTAAGVLQQKTEILSWTFASNAGPPACFAGVVGATLGAPANVLTVNASNGGIQRRVQVPIYQPFAIQMANPPGAFSPSGFILFGHFGAADGSQSMDFGPAGALCFTVSLPNPQAGTFILTDGFNAGVPSLVPGHPAPWVFALGRGIPFTTTVTYQGVIVDPTNPAILSVTNAIILEYVVPPPPHIESISPAAALPGTIVTIQGQNFLANKSLSLNGVPIAPISSGSSTISFLYPANVPCDSVLTVSHPDGQSDSGLLNPSPVITNTVNGAGSSAGGAFFAIFGSGFVPNMTATVGGNPAAIVTQLPDLITVQAPVGTPGVAPVIITTPFGCSVSTIYTYF
ncbi:MAG: IPT/TIG domain-containing protein, partial [Planctomycetes bacterium]|nr:IPT/TIG domain-containing protein [Planctomycetota bacterium]